MNGPEKGKAFDLNGHIIRLGRISSNDIQINDKHISRMHLEIKRKGDKYFIRDLKSTNGTFVNGKQIKAGSEFEIKNGLTILIGKTVICMGEETSEEVNAFLGSINASKDLSDADTEFLNESFMNPQQIDENRLETDRINRRTLPAPLSLGK